MYGLSGDGLTSKKIVAVALTAAMCLGLSMTAFAAKNTGWSNDDLWSPDQLKQYGPTGDKYNNWIYIYDEDGKLVVDENGDPIVKDAGFVTARNAKGQKVDVTWRQLSAKTLKSIDEEGKVAEIFKKNGYNVPDDTDFIPIMNGNITFDEGVPAGGGTLTFQMADLGVNSEGVQAGDTIYVMQETAPGSGVWEVYAATVGQNLDIVVTLPRNGSIVLVKTLSDGTVISLDQTTGEVIDRKPADNVANNNAKGTSTNASGATSPKTGEF